MHRPGRVIAALVGAAIASAVVAAPSSTAPRSISVQGSGWVAWTDFPSAGQTTEEQLIVSARIGPDGEPAGTIIQHSPYGDVHAEVTCLIQVDENTAYVGGRITRGFDYLGSTHSHIAFGIEDNGQGQDPPDLIAGAIFRDRPRPPDFNPCTRLQPFPPVYVVTRGNFVVGDIPSAVPRGIG